MSERYKVVEGSESAHCCFKATVVDTHPNSPFYDESNWVCECFDMESAQKIADLLNATPQPAEQQPEVLVKGYFHPLPNENDYEFHAEENFPDGNDCPDCVPAVIVRKSAVAIQPAPDVKALVEALEAVVAYDESVDDNYEDTVKKVRAALAAHRKQGGGV